MVKKLLLFVVVVLGFAAHAAAQNRPVSGTVTDTTGEPLTGASVQTGTTGVTTDIDGKYTVTVDAKGTLTFSYIGFKSQSIKVDGRTQIDVELIERFRES